MGEPNYITEGQMLSRTWTALVPADPPKEPYEGMLYVDKTDHHLYFYNGKTWKPLDAGGKPTTQYIPEDDWV